jgi:hypothetical protein
MMGRHATAEAHYRESRRVMEDTDDFHHLAPVLVAQAHLCMVQEDIRGGRSFLADAFARLEGAEPYVVEEAILCAAVLCAQGRRHELSCRLLAAVTAGRRLPARGLDVYWHFVHQHEERAGYLRTRLAAEMSEEAYAAAAEAGTSMPLDDALEVARRQVVL